MSDDMEREEGAAFDDTTKSYIMIFAEGEDWVVGRWLRLSYAPQRQEGGMLGINISMSKGRS